jgi:YHS domain-containing protein
MLMKNLLVRGLLAAAVVSSPLAVPTAAMAASSEIYTPILSNLALGGYDAVAYFDAGMPVKGDARFQTEWKGAQFRFTSAAHLAKFRANPAAYAPQFGGYCAWAVAEGHLASGDPLAWRVVNGKLYLNYNADVQARWAKDVPGNISRANRNWPSVLR